MIARRARVEMNNGKRVTMRHFLHGFQAHENGRLLFLRSAPVRLRSSALQLASNAGFQAHPMFGKATHQRFFVGTRQQGRRTWVPPDQDGMSLWAGKVN